MCDTAESNLFWKRRVSQDWSCCLGVSRVLATQTPFWHCFHWTPSNTPLQKSYFQDMLLQISYRNLTHSLTSCCHELANRFKIRFVLNVSLKMPTKNSRLNRNDKGGHYSLQASHFVYPREQVIRHWSCFIVLVFSSSMSLEQLVLLLSHFCPRMSLKEATIHR